mgnify:CR=1 FL=1
MGPQVESLNDPVLEHHYRGHRDAVLCADFNPNQKQAATGAADAALMVWNFRQSARAYRYIGHKEAINDVKFTPTGTCNN